MRAPGTVKPASRSDQTTPATYAAQPVASGASTATSTDSEDWRLWRTSLPSVRAATAAYVRTGSAIGSERPPL